MIPRIPHIVEGEVISVQARRQGERNSILYTCRVQLPNGSLAELPNVEVASLFGGIGDYHRRRVRARNDAEYNQNSFQQNDLDASVGERVYIAFIGGSMYHPVIIAFKEHPNEVVEFENPDEEDPNLVSQYLGLRETVDDTGQWRLTRKGAPEVTFAPAAGDSLLGQAAALAGAAGGLLGGDEVFEGDASPALKPQDTTQRLIVEILDQAVWRVRDPMGGMIEIDHAGQKKGVYISDNDWKSTEDVENSLQPESGGLSFSSNSTDAEYLWLNREKGLALLNARKIAQIYSFDRRRDVTEGNHIHEVGENSTWEIGGDLFTNINGSSEETVQGDKESTINGDYDIIANGAFSATASGNASILLSGGKVAIGDGVNELLDLFDQALTKMSEVLDHVLLLTVPTGVGPSGPPINSADFAVDKVDVEAIKALLGIIKE